MNIEEHLLIRDLYSLNRSEDEVAGRVDRLAQCLGARQAVVGYSEVRDSLSWSVGSETFRNFIRAEPDRFLQHMQKYASIYDRSPGIAMLKGSEQFHSPDELFDAPRDTELCRDWLRDIDSMLGFSRYLGGAFAHDQPRTGFLGLGFANNAAEAEHKARQLTHWLIHLTGASRLGYRLDMIERTCGAMEVALARLNWGVMVLDQKLNLLAANDSALEIAETGTVLWLRNGRVLPHGELGKAMAMLAEAERVADAPRYFCLNAGGADGKPETIIFGAAFRDAERRLADTPEGTIMFLLDRKKSSRASIHMANEIFGLSAAEGDCLELIRQGLNRSEAAEIRGVSAETIKSQIKSILQKTHSRSINEAIGKVADLEPPFLL